MRLGLFAGPIYTILPFVDCLFSLFFRRWMPRDDVDQDAFVEAGFNLFLISEPCILTKFSQVTEKATIEIDENTCTD
jgi:hypothetical protein